MPAPTDRGVLEDRAIAGGRRNCEEQFGGDWGMAFLDNRLVDVWVIAK